MPFLSTTNTTGSTRRYHITIVIAFVGWKKREVRDVTTSLLLLPLLVGKNGKYATLPHHYCYCLCWLEIRDPRRNKHQTEALLFCNEDSLAERWDRWPRTGPRRTFTVVAVEEEDIDMMMDDVKCEGAAVLIKLFFK